ncbi:Uncharacterised protein [Klebsiella michiganensis]|nr:Uncharacterised protein [Klebsiella michiganensis]
MEALTRGQRGLDGTVLLVGCDVSSAHGVMIPLSSADSASDPCTPKNHSSEVKMTYAQPTTAPIEASGVEIVSMMIWWKLVPQWVNAQEIIP